MDEIHAHVQRTVAHEGEPALCVVKLRRGNAQIEQNAVDLADQFALPHIVRQLGKWAVYDGETRIFNRFGGCNRLRVTVNCQQAPFRPQLGQNQTRMATATKSTVDIYAVAADVEAVDGFVQQDGGVFIVFQHAYSDKSCSRSDNGS